MAEPNEGLPLCQIGATTRNKMAALLLAYILVGVPVKAGFFEDKPVLPPFLGEIAFSVFLLPQPALAVTVAQVLTGDPPSTGAGEGTWRRAGGRTGSAGKVDF